jgi:quercetin dioxygenase-like cupin family protein
MSDHPGSEVLPLIALVQYQGDAVVSRQVAKAAGGNVTLFAFDQGQQLSEHTAPFDALLHVLEGEAQVSLSGQPHQLQAGEAILMPAGQPHAVSAVRRFKMLLTMLKV